MSFRDLQLLGHVVETGVSHQSREHEDGSVGDGSACEMHVLDPIRTRVRPLEIDCRDLFVQVSVLAQHPTLCETPTLDAVEHHHARDEPLSRWLGVEVRTCVGRSDRAVAGHLFRVSDDPVDLGVSIREAQCAAIPSSAARRQPC